MVEIMWTQAPHLSLSTETLDQHLKYEFKDESKIE